MPLPASTSLATKSRRGSHPNASHDNALLLAVQALDQKVCQLQSEIKAKERWEWRAKKRRDVVDALDVALTKTNFSEQMELGGMGAVEFCDKKGALDTRKDTVEHEVWGQVLVGAEEEGEELARVLEQRRLLLGE